MIKSLYLQEEDATYEAAKNLTLIGEEQLDFALNNLTKGQLIARVMQGKTAFNIEAHEISIESTTIELSNNDEFCFEFLFNNHFKTTEEFKVAVDNELIRMIGDKLDDLASCYGFELS